MSAVSSFSVGVCDLAFKRNWSQLIDSPTHVKGNILGLVFTSNDDLITDPRVSQSPIESDHLMLSFNICLTNGGDGHCHPRIVFDYSKADWTQS